MSRVYSRKCINFHPKYTRYNPSPRIRTANDGNSSGTAIPPGAAKAAVQRSSRGDTIDSGDRDAGRAPRRFSSPHRIENHAQDAKKRQSQGSVAPNRQNQPGQTVPETEYFPVLFVPSPAIRQYCCVLRPTTRKILLVSDRRVSASRVLYRQVARPKNTGIC